MILPSKFEFDGNIMSLNPFSHVDLRVRELAHATEFYRQLLPATGFTEQWKGFGSSVNPKNGIEGPLFNPEYNETYYAVFFDDPSGNRLEVVHRQK